MPKAEKAKDRKKDKKEKNAETVSASPLLMRVLSGSEGVQKEYEAERRYRPKRLLSITELEKLSKGEKRTIEQAYVRVEGTDGEKYSVRLRKTIEMDGSTLFRIAHKKRTENPAARTEFQDKFLQGDPDRAHDQIEFEHLWENHSWEIVEKTRYYIDWEFEGRACMIHYDIHTGGALDGLVRIEVEFKNDADEGYFRDMHGYQDVLPDWVGQDVTNNGSFGGREIAKSLKELKKGDDSSEAAKTLKNELERQKKMD